MIWLKIKICPPVPTKKNRRHSSRMLLPPKSQNNARPKNPTDPTSQWQIFTTQKHSC